MTDETGELVDGAAKLIQLYGQWPSFHDAAVDKVVIEREGPTVTIAFRLNAAVIQEGVRMFDLRAKLLMRWEEVADLMLSGADYDENNWIGRLTITRRDSALYTEIERMDGIHGWILARQVRVLEFEPIND
jgi:Immunity protein 50